MSKKVKNSAFSKPWPFDRLVRISPPPLHIPVYSTGGLKQLYNSINDGGDNWMQDYGKFTDEKGVFSPKIGMPLLAARYRYLGLLGNGQSAVLIKAEDTFNSDKKVSIKVLHSNYAILGPQEVDCLRKLRFADPEGFSSVIRLQNIFMFEEHYCMVFELLDPKPLTAHLKKITCKHLRLKAIRKITLQLLQALGFLQQQNVIHADLKPDNILLKNENDFSCLKIIDLGNAIHCVYDELSLYYDDFQLQTFLYRAPEVMYGMPFGLAVDMWSLGCILAELYKGEPLFFGRTQKMVLAKMTKLLGPVPQMYQKGKFFHSLQSFAGAPTTENVVLLLMEEIGTSDYIFADFITRLLQYDPAERMTISEAAQHQFLAPELAIRFLLPQPHGQGKHYGYPRTHLTTDSYQLAPEMCSDVTKLQLSSLELLRHNTKKPLTPCTYVVEPSVKKVAQIMPTMQRPKPNNLIHLSSTSSIGESHHNPLSDQSVQGTGIVVADQTLASGAPNSTGHDGFNPPLPRLMNRRYSSGIKREKAFSVTHPRCGVSGLQHIISAVRNTPEIERMNDAHSGRTFTGIAQGKSQSSRDSPITAMDGKSCVKATGFSHPVNDFDTQDSITHSAMQPVELVRDSAHPHRASTVGTGMINLPTHVSSRDDGKCHFIRESDSDLQRTDVDNNDQMFWHKSNARFSKDRIPTGCKQRLVLIEHQHESCENLEENIASHSSIDSATDSNLRTRGLMFWSQENVTMVRKQNADPSSSHDLITEHIAASEAIKHDATRHIQNWLHAVPEVYKQFQSESSSNVLGVGKTAQGSSPTVPDVIKPIQCGSSRVPDVAKPIQNASPTTVPCLTKVSQNESISWPEVTKAVQNGLSAELIQSHSSSLSSLGNKRLSTRGERCLHGCDTDTFGKKHHSQTATDSTGADARNKKRKLHSSTYSNKSQNSISKKQSASPPCAVGDALTDKNGASFGSSPINNESMKATDFSMDGLSVGATQNSHHTKTSGYDSLFSQSASNERGSETSLHPMKGNSNLCTVEGFLEKNESKQCSTDMCDINNIKKDPVAVLPSEFAMSSSSSDCSLNVISDDSSSESYGWSPSSKQRIHKTAQKMNCAMAIDEKHQPQIGSRNELKPQVQRETLANSHRGNHNPVKEDPYNSIYDQVSGIFYRKRNRKRTSQNAHVELEKRIKLKDEILRFSHSNKTKYKDNQLSSTQTDQHGKHKQKVFWDNEKAVNRNHTKCKSAYKSLASNVKTYNSSGSVTNDPLQQGTSKLRRVTTPENRIRKQSLQKSRNRKQMPTMTSTAKRIEKSNQPTATSCKDISLYPDVSETY